MANIDQKYFLGMDVLASSLKIVMFSQKIKYHHGSNFEEVPKRLEFGMCPFPNGSFVSPVFHGNHI